MLGLVLFCVLIGLSLAMLLFVSGFLFFHLGFNALTTELYALAGDLTLLGLAVFLLLAAIALLVAVYRELTGYFNREKMVLRKVWSMQAQKLYQLQRIRLEYRQLQYFNKIKRQRILDADNQKQIRALYDDINQELQAMKSQMSVESYKSFSRSLRKHFKQADAEAMLALQKQFICR
jgi:hypothetical protein